MLCFFCTFINDYLMELCALVNTTSWKLNQNLVESGLFAWVAQWV